MRSITFVAEIGSNHKGIKALAYEYIRQAKLAGADIAKFQLGHDSLDPVRYIDDWAEDLAGWCADIGIEFMASIWSQDALERAQAVGMQRYKIAHQLARDPDQKVLVSKIIGTGNPVYISGTEEFSGPHVYPLYVHDTYPCYLPHVPKDFNSWYGYSSHAFGVGDALIACARGARLIEKHVTLSKVEESIKDNHFALDFNEFKDMVKYGTDINKALGHRPS